MKPARRDDLEPHRSTEPEAIALDADGHRLIGELWPVTEDRQGSVVLLHGGGQTRYAWRDTARVLSRSRWETIAYDARGHGESAWRADAAYDQDSLAGDLNRFAALCATPPVLVGASMGGITSLIAAAEHPDRFRGLVLVDVAIRVDTVEAQRVMDFMSAHPNGFPDLPAAAQAVQAYNPGRPRPPSAEGLKRNVVQRADGRWYWRWDPRLLEQKQRAALEERLRDAARRVSIPTLLVRGSRSQMISAEGLAEFQDCVPHAKVAEIGAGHMVAGDDNDAFSAAITVFLAELTRP